MIKSFKHKGLKESYETGNKRSIQPEHAGRLARILDRLDASLRPQDMGLPGYNLHKLTGQQKGTWSVWVNGNWRVTFRFEGEDAIQVEYLNYH